MRINRYLCPFAWVGLAGLLSSPLGAASPQPAHVTQIANDVQLLDPVAAARPALLNDEVGDGIVMRTGKDSRAELTFSDGMVVRLAAATDFSFRNGRRDLNLGEGAVLVQASKKAKGAKIHAAGAAAAITGTTVMFEYHPGVCKFLVLEGTGRLYRPGHLGDSVLVRPGQMVIGNPSSPLSDPVDFDIGRFVKTSRFVVDLPPLASDKAMAQESQKQQREKSKKSLIDTNLVIFGGGTLVSLVDPAQLKAEPAKPAPSPAATPVPEAAPLQ